MLSGRLVAAHEYHPGKKQQSNGRIKLDSRLLLDENLKIQEGLW